MSILSNRQKVGTAKMYAKKLEQAHPIYKMTLMITHIRLERHKSVEYSTVTTVAATVGN
jgi:2-phospho-L-lactate guanylyltransferase (CobY/MobA/RfbA family)